MGGPGFALDKKHPKVLHGQAEPVEHLVELWALVAVPCCATLGHAHPPRLQQSSQCPTPAARLAHTAL